MHLLIIRHAIALTREQFATTGEDDTQRPLTKVGRQRMRQGARGLRHVVGNIDLLATSPLVRAAETAAIVAAEFEDIPPVTLAALAPDVPPDELLTWLRRNRTAELVAVVGHEPALGTLATWLLSGVMQPRIPLGKGGACLIEFVKRPTAGEGILHWALTPSLLRRIGGS